MEVENRIAVRQARRRSPKYEPSVPAEPLHDSKFLSNHIPYIQGLPRLSVSQGAMRRLLRHKRVHQLRS